MYLRVGAVYFFICFFDPGVGGSGSGGLFRRHRFKRSPLADRKHLEPYDMTIGIIVGNNARLDFTGQFDFRVGNFKIGGIGPMIEFKFHGFVYFCAKNSSGSIPDCFNIALSVPSGISPEWLGMVVYLSVSGLYQIS
uniref:Uncharacterized protein n=1 Tax=Candidatus Kentrum sp. FW TaxID=2126338 RepID=A0A450U487_9GAMM|nr:MAG: hypothetical protein BECKFW1821C_GA0114237_11718 [Candidatus Kentron sp. FW]